MKKELLLRVASSHLMSPSYKGNLLQYILNKQKNSQIDIKEGLNNYHPNFRYQGPPFKGDLHDYIMQQLENLGIFTQKEYDNSFYS